MRASYNWISTWSAQVIWQYVLLWVVSILAFWRVQPKTARLFLIGMPAIGILSVPVSYILLDQLKWSLIPQFQPARALLFVTAFAVILGAAAAIRAAEHKRWVESVLWFVMVLAVPTAVPIFSYSRAQSPLVAGAGCRLVRRAGAGAISFRARLCWPRRCSPQLVSASFAQMSELSPESRRPGRSRSLRPRANSPGRRVPFWRCGK